MKKYQCTFVGRRVGAIGITHRASDVVEVEDNATEEQIKLKLYDKWESISNLKIQEEK